MSDKTEKKTIKTNRYDFILKLGEGGMGVVYKVVDRLTGMLIALKEIKVEQLRKDNNFETASEEELALMNEFQILSSLRHPNIVSVLDYGIDEQLPYFTMELLSAPQILTKYTEGKSQEVKIHLLVQLLQALAYLHHRHILHRDLKPANIIVDNSGVLKVLDFGIALSQDYIVPAQDSISGTLAYLAPEVLQGEPVSYASDLYAFGVIAYEVLAEKYPYQHNDISQLLQSIVHNRVSVAELDDELAIVIARLLEKDPADRYQDVESLLKDFVKAANYKMPVETLAIRESFLQAATFVGREEIYKQLKDLLIAAMAGTGKVCLVAGESGVGKSRLLSELRVLALVERVVVLRGQAVATAGSPYHLWRHIFRHLIIMTDLSDTEASIMGTIVSDIDMLMGHEIDLAPQLAPNAVRERFEATVVDIFRRQKLPMLLILEDLHWADEESLALAKRLAEQAASLPLLFLGSYRNDESPDLPKQIPQAQIITLDRFDDKRMARLSAALLGKFGQDPKLVQFLYHETAGNVFFAIEVIRVLANQVGNLRDISQMSLPSEITAGGVLAVLRQRLERTPAEHYPLLLFAALYGRELDLNLLQHLMPEHNFEQWFEVLSQLAVLEVEDNQWRFTHDKLREEVLRKAESEGTALRDKHQQLALAIEALYPNNPDYLPALAHHWAGAKVADKAVDYNEKVAEMIYRYAPNRAIKHIETAMSFDGDGSKLSQERGITRHAIIGSCHYMMGKNDEALKSLETMVQHLGAAPIPDNPVFSVLSLLKETAIHAAHRLLPNQFIAKQESDWLPELTVTSLYDMPMIYMAQGKMPQALYSILMNVNYIETLKPSSKSNPVIGYAWLHFVLGLIPLHGLSNYYRSKVVEILSDKKQVDEMPRLVKGAAEATLMVNDFYNARWQNVTEHIPLMLEETQRIGDGHSHELSLLYLGLSYQLMGRFLEAQKQFQLGYKLSLERNDLESHFPMFVFLSSLLLKMGLFGSDDSKELQTQVETGKQTFKQVFETNQLNEALYLSLQSSVFLQAGKPKESGDLLNKASEIFTKKGFDPNPSSFFLYEMVLDNARQLLQNANFVQNFSKEEQAQILNSAKSALKFIKQASRIMAFGEPVYYLGQAWILMFESKNDAAIASLQKAIELADRLQLAYYKAIAQLSLAEQSNDSSLQAEALSNLERMGITSSAVISR